MFCLKTTTNVLPFTQSATMLPKEINGYELYYAMFSKHLLIYLQNTENLKRQRRRSKHQYHHQSIFVSRHIFFLMFRSNYCYCKHWFLINKLHCFNQSRRYFSQNYNFVPTYNGFSFSYLWEGLFLSRLYRITIKTGVWERESMPVNCTHSKFEVLEAVWW